MKLAAVENQAHWYVIHAKPKQEDRADRNLRAWQIETFYPRLKESGYLGNIAKLTLTDIVKPLFPGYLFARFVANQLLSKVCFTRGVHRVVSFGEHLTPVEDEVIEVIQSRIGSDGYVKMWDELRPGDRVVIKNGLLKNLTGIFDGRTKGQRRVSILLATVSFQSNVLIEKELVRKLG